MSVMQQFMSNSYLFGGNAPFVEELYEHYLANPGAVPEQWREYFDACSWCRAAATRRRMSPTHRWSNPSPSAPRTARCARRRARSAPIERKQVAVLQLITAYRILGSRWATLDPLKRLPRLPTPELEPAYYGLTEADLDREFNDRLVRRAVERTTLRDILQRAARDLLRHHRRRIHVHRRRGAQALDAGAHRAAARDAEARADDQKRRLLRAADRGRDAGALPAHASTSARSAFRSKAARALIPLLDQLIQRCRRHGRAGNRDRHGAPRPPQRAGQHPGQDAARPVRRVRGQHDSQPMHRCRRRQVPPGLFLRRLDTPGGPVHLTLAFNPSHLEIVNPVVRGLGARAPGPARRRDRRRRCCRC